jgi:hypothetical protein
MGGMMKGIEFRQNVDYITLFLFYFYASYAFRNCTGAGILRTGATV